MINNSKQLSDLDLPSWSWISRNVESTFEKWVKSPACVIVVRGQRRSGKSSTLKKVARSVGQKIIIELYVTTNETFLETVKCSLKFLGIEVDGVFAIGSAIVDAVKAGAIVIIEEIQNASNALQVSLQQGIDHMALDSMLNRSSWKNAGSLFMMGSLPAMVDTIVESRIGALFQRITARITVLPFDSSEIMSMFAHFSITDPGLMLSLHTIFGGKPYPYEVACKAGLLRGNSTNVDSIVKEFFASELQANFEDATEHLAKQLGPDFSTAIRAVKNNLKKTDQEKQINKELNTNEAYRILHNELYLRYGVIEPCYSAGNPKSISRYEVTDSLSLLAMTVKRSITRREDVLRDVSIPVEVLQQMEGLHFERWIREIAEDRRLLCNESAFPISALKNFKCIFAPRLVWDISDCEIDLIASAPQGNLLMIGSCKRCDQKLNHPNLLDHFGKLRASPQYRILLEHHLKLDCHRDITPIFLHFAPEVTEQKRTYFEHNYSDGVHVISLQDMLLPFVSADVCVDNTHPDNTHQTVRKESTANYTMCIVVSLVMLGASFTKYW